MRLTSLMGALALLLAGPALAQEPAAQPSTTVVPQAEATVGGAVRTAPVPEVVQVDPPRVVSHEAYGKKQAPTPRFNDPIPVRQSFAPELRLSAQDLE